MPDAEPSRNAGFFAHALEMLAAGWLYLRARFELAGIEGREAGMHWLKALGLLLGGLVVLVFGYVFLWLALVFAIATACGGGVAWIWVTLGAALLHFAAGVLLLLKVRSLAREPLFPTTLEEFKKDQAWLDAKTAKPN
ncbi:MAG: phage holin family protein [Chthoniobacteraceae bacterium]